VEYRPATTGTLTPSVMLTNQPITGTETSIPNYKIILTKVGTGNVSEVTSEIGIPYTIPKHGDKVYLKISIASGQSDKTNWDVVVVWRTTDY